jgi:hypothetical protein
MTWLSTSRTSWRLGAGRRDQAWVSGPRSLAGCLRGGGLRFDGGWTLWPSETLAYRISEM